MKHILLAISCFCSSFAFAQNLISNPGFEQHTDCPYMLGTGGADNPICTDWTPATKGSPDYYNVCNPGIVAGVPINLFGYMMPAQGNAFVGLYTFAPPTTGIGYEYPMTRFTPLTAGAKYTLSMYVALSKYSNYATNAPSAFFSTYGTPDSTTYADLHVVPQISFSAAGIISDSMSWTHLTGSFVADSAYQYLMIGNFSDVAHTSRALVAGRPPLSVSDTMGAYYYLDSVTLRPYDPASISAADNAPAYSRVVPNPATGNAALRFFNTDNTPHDLYIYNSVGAIVLAQTNCIGNSIAIDTGNMPPGYYHYRLTGAKGVPANGSFMVQ